MQAVLKYVIVGLALIAPIATSAEDDRFPEFMVGATAAAFGGWNIFCEDYRPVCDTKPMPPIVTTLTRSSRAVLEDINRDVNRRITYKTDIEHWGWDNPRYAHPHVEDVDRWDYAEDGFGDCEDYALLKREILIEKGWPRSTLLMTIVHAPLRIVSYQDGVRSEQIQYRGHMVLTVKTNQGDFILDN